MSASSNTNDRFSFRDRFGRRDWIDPTRYNVVQRFFLGRLETLVAARRLPETGLERWQSRLLNHAIYSTYCDCVALGIGDEARAVLHDQPIPRLFGPSLSFRPKEGEMSVSAMHAILDRASKDPRFNLRMIREPDRAMDDYDVTPEERAALKSCRREQLVAVGLDERMTAWIPWQWAPDRVT